MVPLSLIVLISLVCESRAEHPGSSGAPFGADDYALYAGRAIFEGNGTCAKAVPEFPAVSQCQNSD